MPGQPVVSVIVPNTPITDAQGRITFTWLKWFQGLQQTVNEGFDQQGNFQGKIGIHATISGRTAALAVILQNITDTGTISSDYVTDGAGSPITGGKLAYAALFASNPHSGDLLEFNGTDWVPSPAPKSIAKATKEWLDSYDAGSGRFTQSQPSFSDLLGIASPSQLPLATNLQVGVMKPDGTTITIDPDGTIHSSASGITQLTGDVTAGPGSGSQVATLATSGVSAGTYTNATVTVDAKGRVTGASTGSLSASASGVIEILQVATATASPGNPTATFPNNVRNGSTIVVEYVSTAILPGYPAISDTQSNSYTAYNQQAWSLTNISMYASVNVVGGSSFAVTANHPGRLNIYEYANVDSVDASVSAQANGATTGTGSLTASTAYDVVHMTGMTNTNFAGSNANGWGATPLAGAYNATVNVRFDSWYTTLTAAGSVSNTYNSVAGVNPTYAALLALKPRVIGPFQTLTTIGSSGAATLSAGGVLNIPQYSGGSSYPFTGFTAPTGAGFAWQNQGSSVVNVAGSVMVMQATGTGGDQMRFYGVTLPATPWTVTAAFIPGHGQYNGGEGGYSEGLCLTDGTKYRAWWLAYITGTTQSGGSVPSLNAQGYDNATTFNGGQNIILRNLPSLPLCWMRIQDNGTTRTYSISVDPTNVGWTVLGSEGHTNYLTPTKAGIVMNPWLAGLNGITVNGVPWLSWNVTTP